MEKHIINPVKVIDEIDSFYRIPSLVYSLGSRVLLVHGKNFLKHYGFFVKLQMHFNEKNITFTDYSLSHFESDIRDVIECIKIIKKNKIDIVLAVGGGGVLDVAKAAAGICNEPDPLQTFHKSLSPKEKGIPFIAVPTTAGTGAEMTPNAVISDETNNTKKSIRTPDMFPHYAVLDAKLTLTCPQTVTAYSGADALCQAIEAYVSIGAFERSDEISKKAIMLIGSSLLTVYQKPLDLTARKKMLTGSNLAALAFSNCRLGAVHGLAHPLGIRYKIPHGLMCAILLPEVMEHNLDYSQEKYADIGNILSNKILKDKKEQAYLGIHTIKKIFKKIKCDKKLSALGVTRNDLDMIVKECLASSSTKHNPKPFLKEDVISVFEKCF